MTQNDIIYSSMIKYKNPSLRTLESFQDEVKTLQSYIKLQDTQISEERLALLKLMKEAQEKRCMTSIRSGYFVRMSRSTVLENATLPFLLPNGFVFADRMMQLKDVTNRLDLTNFCKTLYQNFSDLPHLLSQLPSEINVNESFLPEGVTAKDFMACSSLPALCGHCWTMELRFCYMKFLYEIAKNLPRSAFTNFRAHWLFSCIKDYIRTTGIRTFLHISLGGTVYKLIRDQEIIELCHDSTKRTSALNSMALYAFELVKSMTNSLHLFPTDLSLLFKLFFSIQYNTDEKANATTRDAILESLLLDAILVPAISLPKTYGILPATYYYETSPSGPAPALQLLAQEFRYILHPQQAEDRFPGLNIDQLKQIHLNQFLQSIFQNISDDSITLSKIGQNSHERGPRLTELLPLLGIHFVYILFSLTDIYLLATIIQKAQDCPPSLKLSAKKVTDRLVTGEPFNAAEAQLQFFRHEQWEMSIFGFEKPEIKPITVIPAPNLPQFTAAEALSSYLEISPNFSMPKSLNLNDFLQFQTEKLNTLNMENSDQLKLYLNYFKIKFREIPPEKQNSVISALDDMIRRKRQYISDESELSTQISLYSKILKKELMIYNATEQDEMPILYSNLLLVFLQSEQLGENALDQKEEMFNQNSEWIAFVSEYFEKIQQFLSKQASYAIKGVARHFLGWATGKMSFAKFMKEHRNSTNCDQLLMDKEKLTAIINEVCASAPQKEKELLAKPNYFEFVIQTIKIAAFQELPLEALSHLVNTKTLLIDLYQSHIGGCNPRDEELQPLFNFAVLMSGIPNIFSFLQYLNYFLMNVTRNPLKIIKPNEIAALKMVSTLIKALQKALNNY